VDTEDTVDSPIIYTKAYYSLSLSKYLIEKKKKGLQTCPLC
jgi:hypothetical protein